MEFRVRNYRAEDAACALPRSPTDHHPLIPPSASASASSPSPSTQDFENSSSDFLHRQTLKIERCYT
ncbi:hypothetical protein QJS04_geneDACA003394 [Acorus gramineus]|uniref:Uncharacterized protein n=1 Tax=Acorus gramineus TaxID=55184 RepID=A0AAV9BSY1_ACOGR|nr:hypothetical protein QJS04_geneDACA003394 [Acorus gramineus]